MGSDRRDPALQGLVQTVDEAAGMPTADAGALRRVGDVVGAMADAAHEMRLAYWGYPHPGSVGDQPLVVVADGREYVVSAIEFTEGRIQIDVERLRERPEARAGR